MSTMAKNSGAFIEVSRGYKLRLRECRQLETQSTDEDTDEVLSARIAEIDDTSLTLLEPLVVTVRKVDEGNFVASFSEANVNASGETFAEAVANWKDAFAFKFKNYSAFTQNKLGRGAIAQLASMRKYLARTKG